MRWLSCVCLGMFLMAPLWAQTELSPLPVRAMWVTQKNLESPAAVAKLIKKAQALHINTLFVQVRSRGMVSYQSRLEPPAFDSRKYPGFDPLAEVLARAKPLGIAVHAWVNVFYVWSDKKRPPDKRHILHRQPRWVLPAVQKQIFLNPSNLDVQNYSLELLHEIAVNYAVDGLHLDYFRYPAQVKNPEWQKIREHNLKKILQALWDWKAERFAGMKLSVAVVSDYHKAVKQYSQSWHTWMDQGLVDWVVPMAYHKNSQKFKNEISSANQAGRDSPTRVIVGIGVWQLSPKQFLEQLNGLQKISVQSSANAVQGVSLFSYEQFSNECQWVWLKSVNLQY